MKTIRLMTLGMSATILLAVSCQRSSEFTPPANSAEEATKVKTQEPNESCNPNAYTITLESRTLAGGNWVWIWSVQNPNPGNGTNGTVQDLSHWGMLASCLDFGDIISAAYSRDGIKWTNFSPVFQVDPSQNCLAHPVLKFDFGTTGPAKSYYRLILNREYSVGSTPGYYKSGKRTNCCFIEFTGIVCDESLL